MKKIKFLAMMMLAGTLTFTSCSDDDDPAPAPTISFSGASSYEVALVDSTRIVFNADIKAEGEIDAFTVTRTEVTGTTETSGSPESVDAKGQTAYTYNFDETFKAADFANCDKILYVFNVTDKDGQSVSKTLTITLEEANQPGAIDSHPAITMGSWTATEGSYYASVDGTVYTQSAVAGHEAEIDFVFYAGSTNGPTLAAPNDAVFQAGGDLENDYICKDWTSPNATKFGSNISNNITWADVTDDSEIVNYASNLTATSSTQLASTNVIPFETVSGKKGFILVTAVDPTVGSGTITIEVKVQQ